MHTTYILCRTEWEKCQEIKCVCILIPTYTNFLEFPSYKAKDALESRDVSIVLSPWRSNVSCVAKPCLKCCWFYSCRGGGQLAATQQSPAGVEALRPCPAFPLWRNSLTPATPSLPRSPSARAPLAPWDHRQHENARKYHYMSFVKCVFLFPPHGKRGKLNRLFHTAVPFSLTPDLGCWHLQHRSINDNKNIWCGKWMLYEEWYSINYN